MTGQFLNQEGPRINKVGGGDLYRFFLGVSKTPTWAWGNPIYPGLEVGFAVVNHCLFVFAQVRGKLWRQGHFFLVQWQLCYQHFSWTSTSEPACRLLFLSFCKALTNTSKLKERRTNDFLVPLCEFQLVEHGRNEIKLKKKNRATTFHFHSLYVFYPCFTIWSGNQATVIFIGRSIFNSFCSFLSTFFVSLS